MCSWIWSGKFRCRCERIEQTSLDREEDTEVMCGVMFRDRCRFNGKVVGESI